jgi:CheY-like chemotaxis protein
MDVDLAGLTEEVVESAYVGYRFDPSILQRKQLLDDETPDKALVLAKAHVYVTLDVDPEIAARRFAVPPGAFRRLMLNLCTNALKYTDHGWIRLELAMDPEDKRKVKLTVADSGRGISREFLKNSLFTPFMQEYPMQSGTGLGMSIVRQLVDELGGTIDVKSQVGVGTSVVIDLQLESTLLAVCDAGTVIPEDVYITAQQVLKGKSACLVGIAHDSRSTATKDAITGLDTYLRQVLVKTFGMIILDGNLDALKGDIAVVQGGPDLDRYLEATTPPVPIVELGGSRSIRDTPNESVVYLGRPYYPRKLAAALLFAIRRLPLPVPKKAPSPINSAPASPPKSTSPTRNSGRQSPKTTSEAQEKEFKPTLLIVDDNIVNLRIISTYCIKHGLSVVQATNGLEAVQAFEARQDGFDVVLMDLQMPVMSGVDAVRGIRVLEEKRGKQRALVVAMTALSGDEVRREAKKAGCDEFLVKPVRMRRVVEMVEGWVAGNAAAALSAAPAASETAMEKEEHREDAKMRAENLGKASAGNVVWESGNSTGSKADVVMKESTAGEPRDSRDSRDPTDTKGKENITTAATARPSASTTATPTATSGRTNQASGNQQTSDRPQNPRLTATLNTTYNAADNATGKEVRRKSA